jgi:molecular chaperone DnaK
VASYHKIIGIDLGTTFSVVSAYNNDTCQPEAFDVPGLQPPTCILPSVVSVSRQGKILVGWQAKRNLAANPQNTIIEVKRKMGTDEKLLLGGQPFTPPMISAMVLKELKSIAEKKMGCDIHDAVITVPAYFKFVQRQATEEAAAMAELNARLLINEPTAAAVAYRGVFQKDVPADEEGIFVVYDLGGGTFDVSVICIQGESVEVMGTSGDDMLGGGDFDDAIADWVFEQAKIQALRGRKDVRARIKAAAEMAKIELSGSDTAIIELPGLAPGADVYCELDRDTFIGLLQQRRPRPARKDPVGLLDETLIAVEEAVTSARRNFEEKRGREDFSVKDVTAFLMVGGSTRIPAVREMLAKRFGRPVLFDPGIVDKAVSLGAAISARAMDPMDRFGGIVVSLPTAVDAAGVAGTPPPVVDLVDVTGHSLGVAVGKHGDFLKIIEKDTEIPAEATHTDFSTMEDNQPAVRVQVFQGEDPVASNNTPLGGIVFDRLEARPLGYHLFDVTFKLDQSGLLDLIVTKRVVDNSVPAEVQTRKLNAGPGTPVKPAELADRRRRLQELFATGGLDPQAGVPQAAAPPPREQAAAVPRPAYIPVERTETPPPMPTSDVPADAGNLEAMIPEDYRGMWKKAAERAESLTPVRKITLQTAIRFFEDAVKSGDAAAIEEYGRSMIETYFANLR